MCCWVRCIYNASYIIYNRPFTIICGGADAPLLFFVTLLIQASYSLIYKLIREVDSMKTSSIKVGETYIFHNVDSLIDRYNGEKIIVKEIVGSEDIRVDFVDALWYTLTSKDGNWVAVGKPMRNMIVSPAEIRKMK